MNNKKFSKEHEWVLLENNIATVGITNYAQETLGDIVFIELPKMNKKVKFGEQVGVVESVKAASELFSPISGEIIEVNNDLVNSPQLLNTNAEDKGWYMKIKCNDINELERLMTFEQYKDITN